VTPDDVIEVLAKCSAYDQRTVGEVDVMAWHEVLARMELTDALEAVRRHYSESSARAMPADILRNARVARDERERQAKQLARSEVLALPSRFEPDEIRDERVKRGVAEVVAALPVVPETERIHQKALKRVLAERGRPQRESKPPKRKGKGKPIPPLTDEVAAIARRYLADGYEPDEVAERFGIDRAWCRQAKREARRIPPRGEWCGQCSYDTRQRWKDGQMVDCPRCKPEGE
jgi:hypothetical protein